MKFGWIKFFLIKTQQLATFAINRTSEPINRDNVSKINEHELIQKCLAGDRAAQKKLYDTYASIMYGLCVRYSSSKEEAMDILQEGFVKVYSKMGQFGFNGSFEGWMKRIFINSALEYYRVNKNHMYHHDVEAAESNPHHDYTVERMSKKEILEAINTLAPGYRAVLNLFVIEGYSHAEISELLGISEGTSKSQLNRARAQLHVLLSKRS